MQNNNKHNNTGFKTPINYFENFENSLFQKLEIDATPKKQKIVHLFSKKNILYASSIAAIILISILIFPKQNNIIIEDETDNQFYTNYIADENIDVYQLVELYILNEEDLNTITNELK